MKIVWFALWICRRCNLTKEADERIPPICVCGMRMVNTCTVPPPPPKPGEEKGGAE